MASDDCFCPEIQCCKATTRLWTEDLWRWCNISYSFAHFRGLIFVMSNVKCWMANAISLTIVPVEALLYILWAAAVLCSWAKIPVKSKQKVQQQNIRMSGGLIRHVLLNCCSVFLTFEASYLQCQTNVFRALCNRNLMHAKQWQLKSSRLLHAIAVLVWICSLLKFYSYKWWDVFSYL